MYEVPDNCIWQNHRYLVDSDIRLNDLILPYYSQWGPKIFEILNELHQRTFYKSLHFQLLDSATGDLAALQDLVTLYINGSAQLPSLPNLKELGLFADMTKSRKFRLNMNEIPNLCKNLNRLHIFKASVEAIMPFICNSQHLIEIVIITLQEDVIDIIALNNERKRLKEAEKVIIYVDEEVYLATKWATKEINLSLIEIRCRYSSAVNLAHDLQSNMIHP